MVHRHHNSRRTFFTLALFILLPLFATQLWPRAPQQTNDDLVAHGKAAFKSWKCFECHGEKGEGGIEGPDLTASILTADEVEKTLKHPPPDAEGKGMPAIPADSPDLKPLVAFVLSLRPKPPK